MAAADAAADDALLLRWREQQAALRARLSQEDDDCLREVETEGRGERDSVVVAAAVEPWRQSCSRVLLLLLLLLCENENKRKRERRGDEERDESCEQVCRVMKPAPCWTARSKGRERRMH